MERSEQPLISLGRHVAELQDRSPQARLDHERGRSRLLRMNAASVRRAPPRVFFLAAALVSMLATLLSAVLLWRGPGPLRFDVGDSQPGAVGAWIAAPSGSELPIHFSDGSELRLAPGGRARVASVSADGAEIALERGSLDLSVVHRESTRWRVRVGPFLVNVVGTQFEASWDPVSERCTIALREGAITVSGPVVGEERAVRAGERLVISPATGTLSTGPIESAVSPAGPDPDAPGQGTVEPESSGYVEPGSPVQGGGAAAAPPPAASGGTEKNTKRAQSGAHPSAARAPSVWRSLAREGKYPEALAAAEREGFDAICASASAQDLHALGEAARLGGDADRAARAFRALRSRFPGSSLSASAAFLLGRSAQDRQKDHAAAADWFTRYLQEQPSGAFAAEASGRLVEARDRAGDSAGARSAAQQYLLAHPDGPHAAYARSVLARIQDAGAPQNTDEDAGAAPRADTAPDAGGAPEALPPAADAGAPSSGGAR